MNRRIARKILKKFPLNLNKQYFKAAKKLGIVVVSHCIDVGVNGEVEVSVRYKYKSQWKNV